MKRLLAFLLLLLAEGAEDRRMPVGGQAVIEGVLMKGPARWGLSVRKPDGMIESESWNNRSWTSSMPWKLPVIRGVVTMVEMMTVGFRALDKSAQIAVGEEEKITAKKCSSPSPWPYLPLWGSSSRFPVAFRRGGKGMGTHFHGQKRARRLPPGAWCSSLCRRYRPVERNTAGVRYHGAEHKTINAYESGAVMTPENIRGFSRIHPRCGTSFLLIVVAVVSWCSPSPDPVPSSGASEAGSSCCLWLWAFPTRSSRERPVPDRQAGFSWLPPCRFNISHQGA